MKTTTTLMDVIQSELINEGYNEFINDDRLTFFNDKYSFIKKVINYDDDVKKIVDRIIFNGVCLENPEHDKMFKKTFINRFLNRQIGQQTMEAFSSQLIYVILVNSEYINMIYNKLEDFVISSSSTTSGNKSSGTSDNRQLSTSLPQNQVNLNVENTQLEYGDNNNISRTKEVRQDDSDSKSINLNIENLVKSKGLLEVIFIEIDQKCFLQTW